MRRGWDSDLYLLGGEHRSPLQSLPNESGLTFSPGKKLQAPDLRPQCQVLPQKTRWLRLGSFFPTTALWLWSRTPAMEPAIMTLRIICTSPTELGKARLREGYQPAQAHRRLLALSPVTGVSTLKMKQEAPTFHRYTGTGDLQWRGGDT